MGEIIRILVADDHPIVRRGLSDLLVARNGMAVIGEAENGRQAVDLARQLQPDLVLMDMIMPDLNGAEATALIKAENPQARVLILTSFGSDELLLESLNAGAQGFLLKDSQPDDLLLAIRNVYRDHFTIPPHLAQKLIKQPAKPSNLFSRLTDREGEVVRLVADGLTNKEIGERLNIGTNTVRSHISNVLRKLNLSNRTQLAILAKDQPGGSS